MFVSLLGRLVWAWQTAYPSSSLVPTLHRFLLLHKLTVNLGLVVFTSGCGCRASLQSLLNSFVERKDLTRLYAIVALFPGIGSMMGAVLANVGLNQGIHKRGTWLGLPFFLAAAAYGISFVGMFVARR